jgi:hypothetical protein
METYRAEMFVVQFQVAKSAQKPTARRTGDNRSFLRVIKTAGFAFHQYELAGLAFRDRFAESRENFYVQQSVTSRAG